jgi:hypothetical protein
MFADLICEGGYPCVLDCDFVERFEAVDDAERFAVFLDYAKPSRSIGGVGGLVYSGIQLAPNDFAYFVIYSGRDRDITLRPRLVRDCRDLYGWEEVFAKVSALLVGPGETFVLKAHKMVHERALFW